jgi:glucose/arabinose dehydrogenase
LAIVTTRTIRIVAAAALGVVAACSGKTVETPSDGCDPAIKVPDGFCATLFADSVGPARHLAVRANGTVIVGVLDVRRQQGGLVVLPDSNRDGRADGIIRTETGAVHGVALAGDSTLYASAATGIYRYRFGADGALRERFDTLVMDLPRQSAPGYTLALDMRGGVIVSIPATSIACETADGPGAVGRNPCPELETSAGIWRFETSRTKQTLANGSRIATGLYNPAAVAVNPRDTMIYAVTHNRGELRERFPDRFDEIAASTRPATELVRIASVRADYGWPYCYYDGIALERVLAPEYAGNPELAARCGRAIRPLFPFAAHLAPASMLFYRGKMLPESYRDGVFIAFQGSGDRRPLPEEGYQVVFVPFKDGRPRVEHEVFADGFAGGIRNPDGARYRPYGLAEGPDGAIYVSDSKAGRIWRIARK